MSTYGFNENKSKKEVYTKEEIDKKLEKFEQIELATYKLRAKGIMNNGEISETSSSARLHFRKRNGMILAVIQIAPINTEGNILLFNEDNSPFSIPEKFKALGNWFPVKYDTLNSKIFKYQLAEGEITNNGEIIFTGAYIPLMFLQESTTVSGTIMIMDSCYYMSNDSRELMEGVDYILGDVNEDGQITQEDLELIQNQVLGNTVYTDKQFKAADVNRDEHVDTGDTFKMSQYLNGTIDHF